VGDQSSGKSSVLQAITKLPFPVDDKMCTRYATEVLLRRSTGPESLVFSIKIDEDSTNEEMEDGYINVPFSSPEFEEEFKSKLKKASVTAIFVSRSDLPLLIL